MMSVINDYFKMNFLIKNSNYLWTIPLFIFIIRIFLSSEVSTFSISVVSYNESCDNQRICDPSRLLSCVNNKCICESPSNQKYDVTMSKCLSVVGGQCSLEFESRIGSHDDVLPRRCIANATCVLVKSFSFNYTECQCKKGFIENSEGNCVPGIGMPCNYGVEECNPLGMVVCKNEKCDCLDEVQIYDDEQRRCVSPAGTHCKYDTIQLGCVKNAICYPFYHWIPMRCTCKPGYVQTKNRTCVLEIEMHKMALIDKQSEVG